MTLVGKLSKTAAFLYGVSFGRWFVGIIRLDTHPSARAWLKKGEK